MANPTLASPGQTLTEQSVQALLQRITSGEWGPGSMLPAEPRLGELLGVSQGTARKALGVLEARGIVERQQGRGTFVTRTTPELALFRFFRVRQADGSPVLPRLLSEQLSKRLASAEERRLLGADLLLQLDRRRALGPTRAGEGSSEVIERILLSAELFPGLAERSPLPNALYALFEQHYGRSVEQISERAWVVDGRLRVDRRAFDRSGACIELRRSDYRLTDGLYYALDER